VSIAFVFVSSQVRNTDLWALSARPLLLFVKIKKVQSLNNPIKTLHLDLCDYLVVIL